MSTPFVAMAGPSRDWLGGARLLGASIVSALLTVACNVNNPGVTPPERELNFPLVLTTSAPAAEGEAPDWLYVANTNYTFRYNSGSLQSFDLAEVGRALDRSCTANFTPKACEDLGFTFDEKATCCRIDGDCAGEDRETLIATTACERVGGSYDEGRDRCCLACRDVDTPVLCDGRDRAALEACCYDSLVERGREFVPEGGEVRVESFVSGIELSSSGERLYLSVRGNDSLLWVDVDGGQLDCEQSGRGRCPGSRYLGIKPPLSGTEAQFSRLPLDLAVGSAEEFGIDDRTAELIFTGHEDGSISFLADEGGGKGPRLMASLPAANPNVGLNDLRINSMRLDRRSGLVYVAQQSGSQIQRLGVTETGGELTPFRTSPLTLAGLTTNTFVRDVAFSPPAPMGEPERLHALVRGGIPFGAPIVRSLYFLELDPSLPNEAQTLDVARVGEGPARLIEAEVAGTSYLFASCYDDRSLFIFATDTRQLVALVRGLLGPFEFAIDGARELAYIADFASSTLRVVDLRGLADAALPRPRIVLTLGEPDLEGGAL